MRVAHRCCMRACVHLDRSTERTGTTITQILLEIVVCSRWRSSSLPLVVLSHTHDTTDNDDLMASISDSLAGGSNNGGFPEFQFFLFGGKLKIAAASSFLCCLSITIFTNPFPEDAAVFFALAAFFLLTPSFFGPARFR